MNPTIEQFNALEKQVQDLKRFIQSFLNSATMPKELGDAMKDRLGIPDSFLTASTVDTSPNNQAVNESGSASYSVAQAMTGYITVTIGGISYKVPYHS